MHFWSRPVLRRNALWTTLRYVEKVRENLSALSIAR